MDLFIGLILPVGGLVLLTGCLVLETRNLYHNRDWLWVSIFSTFSLFLLTILALITIDLTPGGQEFVYGSYPRPYVTETFQPFPLGPDEDVNLDAAFGGQPESY